MSGRNEVESEFPEFSALGDHNHARRRARNTVSKTEQISLRNLPNVGTGLESNELCVWAISDPAVIDIRRDRRADLGDIPSNNLPNDTATQFGGTRRPSQRERTL
jgi:hypothetical protein